MGERDDAKHSVEQTRARIGALAHEVSRRMTPEYAKERAKEMARYKAYEYRDRAAGNPWMLPLLGGAIGALVGKAFTSKLQDRNGRHDGRYAARDWDDDRYGMRDRDLRFRDTGYRGAGHDERYEVWSGEDSGAIEDTGTYTGLEAESGGQGLSDRASDMKDRASEKVGEMKDRLSSTASDLSSRAGEMKDRMRYRADALRDRMPAREDLRSSAQENPGFWAIGAMAVGALFGMIVPVSEGERRALAPAREKVREAAQQATEKVSEKVSEKMGAAGMTSGSQERDIGMGSPTGMTPSSGAGATGPDIIPPDPLH